MLGKKLFQN